MRAIIANQSSQKINRREFLAWLGSAGVTLLAAACSADPGPAAASAPTRLPTAPPPPATATPTPFQPTITATRIPPSPTPDPRPAVAIARAQTYDPVEVRAALEGMLESIGGPGEWIKPGARVGIKVNLTGEAATDKPDQPQSNEYYVTHPAVVRALGEILQDLGAAQILILDGLGDTSNFDAWGYTEVARALGAELVDLCKPDPYPGYKIFPVGTNPRVYDQFYLNGRLAEIDGLISVAKLKPHTTTGVTLSMKNLIGLAPISEYRRNEADNNRSFFHGEASFDTRLPGVIMDLNRAVPVRLALIDGIMTAEGGAGPWYATLNQVKPGLLVSGTDPVAADAVGTALMGFDPQAPAGSSPFLHGENYMEMAYNLGLGTNRLEQIHVTGVSIDEARYPFRPAP